MLLPMLAIYGSKVRWRGETLDEVEQDPAFVCEGVKDDFIYARSAKPLADVRKVIEVGLTS